MTIKEIEEEIDLLAENELTNTGYRRDIARAVWEVALQLAVLNQQSSSHVEPAKPVQAEMSGEDKP